MADPLKTSSPSVFVYFPTKLHVVTNIPPCPLIKIGAEIKNMEIIFKENPQNHVDAVTWNEESQYFYWYAPQTVRVGLLIYSAMAGLFDLSEEPFIIKIRMLFGVVYYGLQGYTSIKWYHIQPCSWEMKNALSLCHHSLWLHRGNLYTCDG